MIKFEVTLAQLRQLIKFERGGLETTTPDAEAFLQLYSTQITDTLNKTLRNFIKEKLA